MELWMVEIAVIWWLFFGVTGYIYWETKINDITVDKLPELIFVSFTGPVAWAIGVLVVGSRIGLYGKVLIPKKEAKR